VYRFEGVIADHPVALLTTPPTTIAGAIRTRGKLQIVIGLLCTPAGCPIAART
jgi:hypothetical protein